MAPFLRSRSKHRSGRRSRTKYDLIKHPHRVGFPKSEPHRARDSPSTLDSQNHPPPACFISPELFTDIPGASRPGRASLIQTAPLPLAPLAEQRGQVARSKPRHSTLFGARNRWAQVARSKPRHSTLLGARNQWGQVARCKCLLACC